VAQESAAPRTNDENPDAERPSGRGWWVTYAHVTPDGDTIWLTDEYAFIEPKLWDDTIAPLGVNKTFL
jgi:hypothetical protein